MKKPILMFFLLMLSGTIFAPAENGIILFREEAINPYLKVWDAVTIVESGKNPNASNLEDPRGGSHGIGQIGQLMLNWYNNKYGTHYTFKDCYNVKTSTMIFMAHMMQFSDIETGVKRWNGSGPKTIEYWNNVKRRL